ncbi:uncharacterized protein LOC103045361 [Astyanax mexicanus]|uniref:uncharacterized protein LOC103045361 n=1 Tax=Astyanax mexicanus TaxID=7994 RepID=UPI0020CB4EFF|nr:uncharacterized protein LOC103045361 [Astyanax mexicanus]
MTTPITEGTGKNAEDCGVVQDLASLFLSTEPEDGEGTPGCSTPFETSVLSTEAELGLESASSPCLFLEDFLVDEDIFMSPECVALPEDHPRPFMEPPVNPAVYVPDPEPILSSKLTKNQTELVPTQMEEQETKLAILELLRLMAEDPVQSHLESEPLDWLQKNHQEPGTEELHSSHNSPPSSIEAMDYGAVPDLASLLLSTDELITMNTLQPDDGKGTLGDPTPFETSVLSTEAKLELGSASAPCNFLDYIFMSPECVALPEDHPKPFMEPPVNPAVYVPDPEPIFGSKHTKNQTELVPTQMEEQETKLAILELLCQKNNQGHGSEKLHSSHNFPPSSFEAMENAFIWPPPEARFISQSPPEPQPFQDVPGPSLPLNLPSTSNYVSTEPCGNAYQLPRLQHVHPSYLPVVPCLTVNGMQSNHQLPPDFFQPSLQLPNGIWLPHSSYMKINQSNFTVGPQVPQMYSTTSSVSAAPSFSEVPLLPCQDFQCNTSHEHEQPLVVQSCCEGYNPSKELYKNYRRWQMFCKVASFVYTSSPDVEALACFFIQVINSITLQCPGVPRFEAVKIAVSQWEKLSDFERMEYYHEAQRFMDYELKEMVSLWTIEAASSQDTEQQQQTPTVRDEPPAMGQAADQKKGSNSAPPDVVKAAPDEYSEVMEAPETNDKEESDDNQDKKFMQYDDKEQDGFCSHVVSEDDSEVAPEVCHLHPQSPDESIYATAPEPKQHPEPQPQTLQSGYYIDNSILPPPTTFSEKPALLNQSSDPGMPLPDKDVPVPASSTGLQLLPFQNVNTQVKFEMFPPLPEPLSYFQMSSINHSSMGHPDCVPENCSLPTLAQKHIHSAVESCLSDQNVPSSSHTSAPIIGSVSEDIKQASSPKTLWKQFQSTGIDFNSFQNDLESPENTENITSGASVEMSSKDVIKEDNADKGMTGQQSQNKSMADLKNDRDGTDMETFHVTDNNDDLPKMVMNPVEQACPAAQLPIKDNLNEPIDHHTEYHHPEVTRLLTTSSSSSPNFLTSSTLSTIPRSESKPNQEPKEINNKAVHSFVMDTRKTRRSGSLQSEETAGKHVDVKMKTKAPKQAVNPMLANEGHRKHHLVKAKEMTTGKAARRGKLNWVTLVDERRWTRSFDKKDKDVQAHNKKGNTNYLVYNRKTSLVDMPRVIKHGADEEKVPEIQVIDQSERIDQFERSVVQDQVSNGSTDQRRITRKCCTASQQLLLGNGGKGKQNLDKSIGKNKTSLTEVQEKAAKRSQTRQHSQHMVMTRKGTRTKQEETARKRPATSTTGLQWQEQRDLGQDQQSRCEYQGLQCQGLNRSSTRSKKPLKSSLLALVLTQTRRKEEERTNDKREEIEGSLTRAKRANSDKSLESLPTKKQKMTSNKKPGFQFDVANLKASSTPSSSERPRWKTRGSPATPREMRAEEREQRRLLEFVLHKNTIKHMVKSCGAKE